MAVLDRTPVLVSGMNSMASAGKHATLSLDFNRQWVPSRTTHCGIQLGPLAWRNRNGLQQLRNTPSTARKFGAQRAAVADEE